MKNKPKVTLWSATILKQSFSYSSNWFYSLIRSVFVIIYHLYEITCRWISTPAGTSGTAVTSVVSSAISRCNACGSNANRHPKLKVKNPTWIELRRNLIKISTKKENAAKICLPSGQSSPGNVHSVQQLSNGIRQIPQLSSFAIQRQVATLTQSKKSLLFGI